MIKFFLYPSHHNGIDTTTTAAISLGWKRKYESWIITTKHLRIMNLCFNLEIMNLCTLARESLITRLWEKLNKIHVWISCVWSLQGMQNMEFPRVQFLNIFPGGGGACPRAPCIIRAFGLVSYKNNSIPTARQNEWLHPSESGWSRTWSEH